MACADDGTLEACLSSIVLPASSAGTAARNTCQKGKFHGMMARTVPSGWKLTKLRRASVATGCGSSMAGPAAAKCSHSHAHLSTSWRPCATGLPISRAISSAYWRARWRRSGAAAPSTRARSRDRGLPPAGEAASEIADAPSHVLPGRGLVAADDLTGGRVDDVHGRGVLHA